MPNLSAYCFFLSVIVHTLCVVPVLHLSYYFRYFKPAKEAQTSNYILGLPGAGGDRGQVLRALGEAILLEVGLALAVWVSISLCHFVLGTSDSLSLYLARRADIA